jgi:secreted trypsin-like serine protease
MRSPLIPLFAVATLVGCGPTMMKPEGVDPDQLYIFHGSPTSEPYQEATVSIHKTSQWGVTDPFCTGTLISDRWILTAAHCTPGLRASETVVHFGPNARQINPAKLHTVRQVIANPAYNAQQITNDVALLELTSPVTHTAPVMPLPASIGLTSADTGKSIDLAGFGFQENNAYAQRMHVEVPLAQVRSTQIEYDQGNGWSGTGGACNGDSGGPAFFERNGQIYVAGITSYGDANCTDYGVSTKVDAFESFIESVTGMSIEPGTGSSGGTSPGGGGGTPPATGGMVTETYSGFVNQGYLVPHVYKTLDAGTHDILMTGPPGTDFDLYMAQKINGEWVFIAEATTPSNVEALTVTVPAGGKYAVGVAAFSGSGSYAVEVTRPQ